MRMEQKYPPSKLRYIANNPYITFNIPLELKEKIEEICQLKGLTKAQLVKNFFFDVTKVFDDLKTAHIKEIDDLKALHTTALEEVEEARKIAYTQGYKKAIADAAFELEDKYKALENEKLKFVRLGYNLHALRVPQQDLAAVVNTG